MTPGRMDLMRTRRTIVIIGLLFCVAAFGYWMSRDTEVYIPWLWPGWLAAGGCACILFAARIASPFWWQTSRILVVIGVLSRVISIALRAVDGRLPNAWSGLGGAAVYLICALVLHRLWSVDFRYWSRRATVTGW